MRSRPSFAWLPIAAAVLASAPLASAPLAARAQTAAVCTLSPTSAEDRYECGLQSCANADECSSDRFGPALCDAFLNVDVSFCRPKCGAIFGCMVDVECPRQLDREGTCVVPASRPPGLDVAGICVYRGLVEYCTDAITAEHIDRCHTAPDGARTSSWLFGDCDHDSCPNGRDPSPCAAGPRSECGSVTLGEAECVAPVPPFDGGVPELDAGIAPSDAGIAPADGGGEDDGGTGEADAGASPDDAGALDAGTSDAGETIEPPGGISFNGGGGCRCAVPGGSSERSGGALAGLALALGALVARRRRGP